MTIINPGRLFCRVGLRYFLFGVILVVLVLPDLISRAQSAPPSSDDAAVAGARRTMNQVIPGSQNQKSSLPANAKKPADDTESTNQPPPQNPKPVKQGEPTSTDLAAPGGLRPFGYDFFLQAGRTAGEANAKQGVSVPNSYVLGVGDDVNIIISSPSGRETQEAATVNPDGNLYVSGLGLINVTGMTLTDLEYAISERLSARFRRSLQAVVSVVKVHAIQIYVTGEAMRPGSYVLSGLATPVDALYASGGPSLTGSMRDIRIIRRNKLAAQIDFYDYLLKGRITPMGLESDDVILISPRGPVVGIQGEVLRPAQYEIAPNENLGSLVRLAGGALPTTYAGRVRIDRINGDKRTLTEADLGPRINSSLFTGDMVTVYSILPEVTNAVEIKGGIKRPGFYGFYPGMKVSDLIRLGAGFSVEIYTQKADIFRSRPDHTQEIVPFSLEKVLSHEEDPLLQPGDSVAIYPLQNVTYQERKVAIKGAIARPATYDRLNGMRMRDLILLAGGLNPDAASKADLARMDGGKVTILQIDLREVMENPESEANLILQDRDTLFLKTETGYQRWAGSVTIKGEVAYPGDYPIIHDKDTLSSLISKAGGLTPRAFAFGAVFVRPLDQIAEKEQLDVAKQIQSYVDLISQQLDALEYAKLSAQNTTSNFALQKTQTGATQNNSTVAQAATNLPITTVSGVPPATPAPLPRQPSAVLSSGRIPINLEQILKNPGLADLNLKNGDVIYVPPRPSTVIVAGAVFAPSALLYTGGKVSDYLSRAGGPAINADNSHLLIVKANGETVHVSPSSPVGLGDIVLVPTKGIALQKSGWDKITDVLRVVTELAVFKAIF